MTPIELEMMALEMTGDPDVVAEFSCLIREFVAGVADLMARHFCVADEDGFVDTVLHRLDLDVGEGE